MNMLEEIVNGAKSQGWDFFETLPTELRKRVELDQAKSEADKRAIAAAWASFAATPGGAKALELLFGATLRRTVFFVNLNLPPDQAASWGFFREGQNALAYEIARQIAAGQHQDPPEPRDV